MNNGKSPGEFNFISGQMLHRQRLYREAEENYRSALQFGRTFQLLYMLGVLLVQDGRPSEAAEFLEEAATVNTRSFEVERDLGAVYEKLGRRDDAITRYSRSVDLNPDQDRTLFNLFQLLVAAQQLDLAIIKLGEVIERAPYMATAQHLMANACFYMGRMKEAEAAIREAIRLEPKNGMHYRILAYVKTFLDGDSDLARIESLNDQCGGKSLEEAVAIKFALYKAYDDLGRRQHAFDTLVEANRRMRERIRYDAEEERAAAQRVSETFTIETLRVRSGLGDPSDAPIFILGVPRSGTTLVEQILVSHPSVAMTGESPAFDEAVRFILPNYKSDLLIHDSHLKELARYYLAANKKITAGAERFTDKMLGNIGYVGLIHMALPNARFVHVVRDPIDTCLSCYSTKFGGIQQPFAYDLYELGAYYRMHEDLMRHWRRALPPGSILTIRYEDLVADLKSGVEKLLAHVNLDWWEGCLFFENNGNPVCTASAAQVRRPIYKSSVGRWRPEASVLQPLLNGLGPYANPSRFSG